MVQLKTILSLVCVALGVSLATAYDWVAASAALVSGGNPVPGTIPPCDGDENPLGCEQTDPDTACPLNWSEFNGQANTKKFYQGVSARLCTGDTKCASRVEFPATLGCTKPGDN